MPLLAVVVSSTSVQPAGALIVVEPAPVTVAISTSPVVVLVGLVMASEAVADVAVFMFTNVMAAPAGAAGSSTASRPPSRAARRSALRLIAAAGPRPARR